MKTCQESRLHLYRYLQGSSLSTKRNVHGGPAAPARKKARILQYAVINFQDVHPDEFMASKSKNPPLPGS